jgi:hypothetical protein
MALAACGTTKVQYRVPTLNEADQAHLTCRDYPEIREVLAALPAHAFLSGSDGQPVETAGGQRWVRFDIVNRREGALILFGDRDGRTAHFECQDDLRWIADVWTDLQD